MRPLRSLRSSLTLTLVAIAAGCGVSTSSGATGGSPGGSNTVLTQEQLSATNETDLYIAIQRLRSSWLRPRGQATLSGTTVVTVFVDGSLRGDVSVLRGMPVNDVTDVEYLSSSEAAFRFGTSAGNGGTLAIRTRR